MKYVIVWRDRRHRFSSIEAAITYAGDIHRRTGIIVAITEELEP